MEESSFTNNNNNGNGHQHAQHKRGAGDHQFTSQPKVATILRSRSCRDREVLCKYNFSFNYSVDLLHGESKPNSSLCNFAFDTVVVVIVVIRNSRFNRFGAATIETCSGNCASCVFNMENVSIRTVRVDNSILLVEIRHTIA